MPALPPDAAICCYAAAIDAMLIFAADAAATALIACRCSRRAFSPLYAAAAAVCCSDAEFALRRLFDYAAVFA